MAAARRVGERHGEEIVIRKRNLMERMRKFLLCREGTCLLKSCSSLAVFKNVKHTNILSREQAAKQQS